MHNPLVSIIIPIYNCEKYIENTLNSILNSDYSNIEIICIDDGSNDNSLSIVEKLSEKNPSIRYYTQPNQGVSIARNNGLKQANGKYVMFVDSDDLITSNALSKSIQYLEENNADIICFNMLMRIKNSKDIVCFNDTHFDSYLTVCKSKDYNKAVNFTNAAPCVISKEFLVKHNIQFKPKHIYEDWIFMIEIFSQNPYCVFLNESMYIYQRRAHGSITCDISSNCLDIFDSYKLSDIIIKNTSLNSSWIQINDLKIFNNTLGFLLYTISKAKKTKMFKEYSVNIKNLIYSFNPVYIECLLNNANSDLKNAAEYISSNKSFSKNNFKRFLHKKTTIKSLFNFISHMCSYWYYCIKDIISND